MKKIFDNLQNILKVPDLRKKLFFTLFIFFLYRMGGHIPLPGINLNALKSAMGGASGAGAGLFGLYDLFVGGAFRRATIFSVGIMPYISASIIIQLLGSVVPYFQRLQKEGEEGRKKITQLTRYGAIIIAALQGWGITAYIQSLSGQEGSVVINPGIGFTLTSVLSLVTGGAIIMWLGEILTEKGIGNGMSLLIFIGIVARFPDLVIDEIRLLASGAHNIGHELILIVLLLVFTAAAILLTQGTRKIPVQYARRVVGRRVYGGHSTHLPLKINASGVIPIIFAQAIVTFIPSLIIQILPDGSSVRMLMESLFNFRSPFYNALYGISIVFFAFFYTAIIFNPVDVANNLQKYGGFIPGRRAGSQTSEYIDKVLTRVTLPGAVGLGLIAIIPGYLIPQQGFANFFGGTSILIIVGVAIDTLQQMESQLLMRHYDGFLKKGKIKGRRG